MSDSMTQSETESSPSSYTKTGNSASQTESLHQKLLRQWAGLKLADYGLQIDKDGRRQQLVERLIHKTQDGTLGQTTDDPALDEMAVNVGDQIENHYHATPKPSRASGTLGKVLTGAALVAGGAGAALAAHYFLSPEPTPHTADTDTDTQYSIGIKRDGENKNAPDDPS